jgi:hypothetical protein
MQRKTLLLLLSVACFTMTACSGNLFISPTLTPVHTLLPTSGITPTDTPLPTETPVPLPTDIVLEIVNHEKPNIQTDFAPFQNIGCNQPDKKENRYRCEEGSQLFDAGCTTITNLPLLGGLSPNYPIALCTLEINREFAYVELPPDECLYADGFMTTFCNRYIIYKDGKFQLIRSMDEFQKFFAPVETPNEALAFALADGKFIAQYNQTKQNDATYSVSKLEDTHVEIVEDGYIVHVFFTFPFGCTTFGLDAVELQVSHTGNIAEINRFPVYLMNETTCKE